MAKRLGIKLKIDFTDVSKVVGLKVLPISKNLIPTIDLNNASFNFDEPLEVVKAYNSSFLSPHPVQMIELQSNTGTVKEAILCLGCYFKPIETKT